MNDQKSVEIKQILSEETKEANIVDENDIDDIKKSIARSEFDIKEKKLNSEIFLLKERNTNYEEENMKLKSTIKNLQEQISSLKTKSIQQQTEVINSNDKYDELVRKLLLLFQCSTIEEVYQCAGRNASLETKISLLTQILCQLQYKLSESELRNISKEKERTIQPSENNSLENNDINNNVKAQIDDIKEKYNQMKINEEAISINNTKLKIQINQLTTENKNLKEINEQLIEEITQMKSSQPKQIIDLNRRINFIDSLSKRLNPKFLCISKSSKLYPLFDSLNILFQSISDTSTDAQDIVRYFIEFNNITRETTSNIEKSTYLHPINPFSRQTNNQISNDSSDSLILQQELKKQKEEYEDTINDLKSELLDIQSNDRTPEVAMWKAKCKKLEDELHQLKEERIKPRTVRLPDHDIPSPL